MLGKHKNTAFLDDFEARKYPTNLTKPWPGGMRRAGGRGSAGAGVVLPAAILLLCEGPRPVPWHVEGPSKEPSKKTQTKKQRKKRTKTSKTHRTSTKNKEGTQTATNLAYAHGLPGAVGLDTRADPAKHLN